MRRATSAIARAELINWIDPQPDFASKVLHMYDSDFQTN
jgi:hypothetical protein